MFDPHDENWGYESAYGGMAYVESRGSATSVPRDSLFGGEMDACCDGYGASMPNAVAGGLSERSLSEYR